MIYIFDNIFLLQSSNKLIYKNNFSEHVWFIFERFSGWIYLKNTKSAEHFKDSSEQEGTKLTGLGE